MSNFYKLLLEMEKEPIYSANRWNVGDIYRSLIIAITNIIIRTKDAQGERLLLAFARDKNINDEKSYQNFMILLDWLEEHGENVENLRTLANRRLKNTQGSDFYDDLGIDPKQLAIIKQSDLQNLKSIIARYNAQGRLSQLDQVNLRRMLPRFHIPLVNFNNQEELRDLIQMLQHEIF